jgi:hypothetical protein
VAGQSARRKYPLQHLLRTLGTLVKFDMHLVGSTVAFYGKRTHILAGGLLYYQWLLGHLFFCLVLSLLFLYIWLDDCAEGM